LLLTPFAVLYLAFLKCGAAAAAAHHGLQFPNQNLKLKYAIDLGALPNPGMTPNKITSPQTTIPNTPVADLTGVTSEK